jgi:SH3-like domain-containing protein
MHFDSRYLLRVLLLGMLLAPCAARAADAPPQGPHYASLRRPQANLREGPSYDHRILWIYQHKDYPVKILSSYDAWRRVKDVDGAVGWMHHSQLTDRRTVLFIGAVKSPLRRGSDPHAAVVAFAQPGVVARLKACELAACEVEAGGVDGWVDKRNIWGVEAGEVFE